MSRVIRCAVAVVTLATLTRALEAQVKPEKRPDVAAKSFRHPDLDIETRHHEIGQLPRTAASEARRHLGRLSIVEKTARVDRRSGRFVTLLPTTPLLPGRGVGNRLTWNDLGVAAAPKSQSAIEEIALDAFRSYLDAHQADLLIDPSELSKFRIVSHGGGDLIQIHAQRAFEGVPVRGSFLSATIGQGNLTLMSTHHWGDRRAEAKRRELTAREAVFAAREYLAPLKVTREWGKPHRLYLPMALGNAPGGIALGRGYSYRLAWSIKLVVDGDQGAWEVLVDASSGEILANEDQNHYGEARGGVYPVSNDGLVPDGVEQAGRPMPYQEVSTPSGTETTDSGGNLSATGSLTATFFGPYVDINDNCGSASLTGIDTVNWGASGGTDCATPGFGGAGNTHASRTGFYELNKIIEMARGQLPNHPWLQSRLTSNMNIDLTCNAFFSTANGSVNFYRSGGGCFNTGEIAGVFDHEWGHGMDFNDVNGGIARPSGEGVADIYTALRLNDSCIGRNFRATVCTGFGDPCLTCTGVRDIDYLKRQSGQPHDYSWSNANCGGQVHCVGSVYAEAVWSLWKRILQAAPYSYDDPTAHEIVTRLSFLGAGATSTWFSGGPPNGGCGGSSGYMNYLAADDDNGNLNDGTPHMTAIFQAFNDQEIACNTPAVQDSGCSGTPSTAPSLTGTSGNRSASLSWNTVSGASSYEVFRTEGVFGCDFGRVKLGETTGTSWSDSGLQNGRGYSYIVIPKGPSNSCFGPASSCATLTPASGPDFSVSCAPGTFSIEQGQNVASTCTVTADAGFSGTVHLSCSGAPSGIGCAFSPSSLDPTGTSTLTLSVDLAQKVGTFLFDAVGDDGSVSRTSGLSVTVMPEGQNGPQDAAFDAGLGAPRCSTVGSECDSVDLLDGRGGNGPEPNQPNTLDACADGASGTYHSDESNDRLLVRTLDSLDFVEGATVEVEATVWAWTTPSSDRLDLYFAADATNPNWTLIDSITPPAAGAQTLSAQYTLPAGSLQAVRANFRYQGSQSPCSGGAYDDADDLVFAVAPAGPQCRVDADCDDGLFCNGAEVCNAGSCQAGTAPSCDDSVACTVDICNEDADSCDNNPDDALCDNGFFCDGAEICDAVLDCQDGPDPCSGSQTCNETSDVCFGGGPCAHSADFESDAAGWTDGAGTCTTGAFVVGPPDATAWQVGGGHPGSAFFTQPNLGGIGSDDVDGGTCEALSPVVDCNGQAAAAVSLDYFHGQRDDADDANDGFTIEVLNNGSVVDTIVAIGDVTHHPAWTNVSTVVPNPGNLQIRVRATDAAGSGDIVEGGIDNVSITPATPPSCTVDEDFESGAAGWGNDAASTCTTGAFVTGEPTNPGGGQQIAGSHSGATSIFTAPNTAAGTDDVDGGNCILGSPTWHVINASTLSVWYWHGQRDDADDALGDFFVLEYSTDGGSSWTAMASNGDSASTAAWTRATAQIPDGANVKLRVQCSDGAAGGDLVECGIDDVSICSN